MERVVQITRVCRVQYHIWEGASLVGTTGQNRFPLHPKTHGISVAKTTLEFQAWMREIIWEERPDAVICCMHGCVNNVPLNMGCVH